MLVGHALRKGLPMHDACEVVQELFLKLLQSGQYETLAGYDPAQQGVWLRQKLSWHLIDRHRSMMRKLGGCVQVTLDDALQVSCGESPEVLHDRGLLATALKRAGVSEANLFQGGLTSSERVRLSRWRKGLRPRFQHFLT